MIGLIGCLTSLSLFQSNEQDHRLYFLQEKSAAELLVDYSVLAIQTNPPDSKSVESFISEVKVSVERKKIYLKELIDYLNEMNGELRMEKLYANFHDFYLRCQSAYGFFLSDYSYSKLKLELESSVLDYSKNVRSIINDSQSKLIAIPAAFLVASSQLDLSNTFILKNLLLIFSSLIFSLLIEIFIRNQESSLAIFVDNIKTYKTTFKLRNHITDHRENIALGEIIGKSFNAVDSELANQKKRLTIIRWINWGMSALLVIIVIVLYEIPSKEDVAAGILALIFAEIK